MVLGKRRATAVEDEDATFERDKLRIADALALFCRIEAYPQPPTLENGESTTSVLAHSRALIAYEAQRAVDLGLLFEPPCSKCGVKKECVIDISTLVGRRRTFRCKACVMGKVACGNADKAIEAHARWPRYLAMGQGRGDLGREWSKRVAANSIREWGRKQARMDRDQAMTEKRSDQVRFRALAYGF